MSNTFYNIQTEIIIKDYKDSFTSLSSYNLPITPLYFNSTITSSIGPGKRAVWFFGDGNSSFESEPIHYYKEPGVYDVNLFLIDGINQSQLVAETRTVVIKDYIEDTFRVLLPDNIDRPLSSYNNALTEPFVITQTIPARLVIPPESDTTTTSITSIPVRSFDFLPRSKRIDIEDQVIITATPTKRIPSSNEIKNASTIYYKVSNSNSPSYFDLIPDKYNHLRNSHSVYKKEYVPILSGYENIPVSNINIPLTAVYVKLDNNTLIPSLTSDSYSILAGFSGQDTFYYKDSSITYPNSYYIDFFKRDRYNNQTSIILQGVVKENLLNSMTLAINSNGIGDEGVSTSFNIDPNKFSGVKIHFICRVKDILGNTMSNVSRIPLSSINLGLGSLSNYSLNYTLCSLEDSSTEGSFNGCFRGYIQVTNNQQFPLTGLFITANIGALSSNSGVSLIEPIDILTENSVVLFTEDDINLQLNNGVPGLNGTSSLFNVYPKNYYNIYKKGEEFDGEEMYKSLRFQETLLDDETFFGDFLGPIMGDKTSDQEALSKKIFERISNFLNNTNNIDTAEIIRLLSLGDMLSYSIDVFDNNLLMFPNKLQRLTSLLSLKKDELFGYKNQYNRNLIPLDGTNRETYGKNLGDYITDPISYTVTASSNIVAYEKYSKVYKILNTYQPLCASIKPAVFNTIQYKLSDYNSTWGWPIDVPNDGYANISTYYDFYEFKESNTKNIVGGVINFDISNLNFETNYQDLIKNQGIFDNIILDTLYSSLSLTK